MAPLGASSGSAKISRTWSAAKRYNLSLNGIADRDVHRLRRIAGPIAASLIAQLSGSRSGTRRSIRRHLEIRHQKEVSGVHRKRLFGKLVLLQFWFGVRHRAALQKILRSEEHTSELQS